MIGEYVYKRKLVKLLVGLFDLLGYALKSAFAGFQKQPSLKSPKLYKNILLIRLDHMGDGLFILPALREARRLFPKARITLLAGPWASSFVRKGKWVDEVKLFRAPWFDRPVPRNFAWSAFWEIQKWMKEQAFEIGFDFRGDLRHIFWMAFSGIPLRLGYGGMGAGFLLTHEQALNPSRHEVERNLDLLRFFNSDLKAGSFEVMAVSPGVQKKVDDLLARNGVRKGMGLVIFQVTAGYSSKEWAPEKFVELIEKVTKKPNLKVVVIGAGEDVEKIVKITSLVKGSILNFCGKTSLEELAALLLRAKAYVGLDSGPAHLAVALGTPSVLIYSGVNDLRRWGPWTLGRENKVRVLHCDVPCSPCSLSACNRKHECLEPIQPGDVLRVLNPYL